MPENVITLASTTAPQLRLSYDSTYYTDLQTGSDGSVTVSPTGAAGALQSIKFPFRDGIVLQFPTEEAGRNYNMTMVKGTNPDSGASGRDHYTMRLGYNIGHGGGVATSGEHSLAIEMENYWYQAGWGYWTEFHAAYTSRNDDATRRLWSWLIDVDDDTSQMYFQAGAYEFRDFSASPGVSLLSISSTRVQPAVPLRYGINDDWAFYGWTAGGLEAPMLKFNAFDQVEIGSALYGTYVVKTLQIGVGTGQSGAQAAIYASTAGGKTSAILLNNASQDAGTGTVIECGWGSTDSKLRFGMVNGNSFVVDSYAASTWTNRLTLSNVGLLTITGGLTLAGVITQTVASANHIMTSSTGTNPVYTKYANTGGDMYVGRNGNSSGLGTGTTAYGGVINVGGAYPLQCVTNGTIRFQTDANGNVVVGTAALATTATDGFLYIPSCAGTPTGVPTAYTGRVPLQYDSTNNKLYIYDGGWVATAALT